MLNDADRYQGGGSGGEKANETVKDADALLTRLKRQVKVNYNSKGQVNWRHEAREDFDFEAGEQLNDEDKAILQDARDPAFDGFGEPSAPLSTLGFAGPGVKAPAKTTGCADEQLRRGTCQLMRALAQRMGGWRRNSFGRFALIERKVRHSFFAQFLGELAHLTLDPRLSRRRRPNAPLRCLYALGSIGRLSDVECQYSNERKQQHRSAH
jgi:hypothetical protein